MTEQIKRPLWIVEDSDEDFEAIQRAFHQAAFAAPLVRFVTGEAALQQLRAIMRNAKRAAVEAPTIILLDLNLPGDGGREVLAAVKRDPQCKHLPIVILTSSTDPGDVDYCYFEGANSYLPKPINFDRFRQIIRHFIGYWYETAVLPARGEV